MSVLSKTKQPDMADNLRKMTMRTLSLGHQRHYLFQHHANELIKETLSLLLTLKKRKRNSQWLTYFRWAVFSMTVSSSCYLLVVDKKDNENELYLFVKILNQCISNVIKLGDDQDEFIRSTMIKLCNEIRNNGLFELRYEKELNSVVSLLKRLTDNVFLRLRVRGPSLRVCLN
jgi:hypothetical protein